MTYYTYSIPERLRQIWRVPVTLAFFSAEGVYSYRNGISVGTAFSEAFFLATVLAGLWIATLHPTLGITEDGIFAFRFGMRLRMLPWSSITRIKKVHYYRNNRVNGAMTPSRRGALRRSSAKWRVEIIGEPRGFFRIAFSSKIGCVEDLVAELNAKIPVSKVPIQTLSDKSRGSHDCEISYGKLLNTE